MWKWIWEEAGKAAVWWFVWIVPLPYVLANVPGIREVMIQPVAFTLPVWVLATIGLLAFGSLAANLVWLLGRLAKHNRPGRLGASVHPSRVRQW